MSRIRSRNTPPEVSLRKELWRLGYRYRLHVGKLPGKPDIVLGKFKIAIFVDGGFWHGHDWERRKAQIKAHPDYWIPKIERNMRRDEANTRLLREMGYVVFRFWDHDLKKNLGRCVDELVAGIRKR